MTRRRRISRRPGRLATTLVGAILVIAVGYFLGKIVVGRAKRNDRSSSRKAVPAAPAAPGHQERSRPRKEPVRPAPRPAPERIARVSIVIDDLGRSTADVDRLLAIGVPLGYAVLPWETRTAEVGERLRAAGAEVLCHLPMEAEGGANPGPNAIRERQRPREVAELTRRALDALPGATGVNNHMGSRITADRDSMRAILAVVAKRGLFFLDSRTTSETVAFELARELSIPAEKRDVFLDRDRTPAAVDQAFDELLALAREHGAAIAIGHPHEATLEVLERRIPAARAAGIEFVPPSYLLERSEATP